MLSDAQGRLLAALDLVSRDLPLDDGLARELAEARPSDSPVSRALLARCLGYGEARHVLARLLADLADPDNVVVAEALASIRQTVAWAGLPPWGTADNADDCFSAALTTAIRRGTLTVADLTRICAHLVTLRGATTELTSALAGINAELGQHFQRAAAAYDTQNYPPQITIIPTYHCNISCAYCYSGGAASRWPPMSRPALERVVEHAATLGCRRVGFSGGEPTTYPDFADLLALVHQRGMRAFFATNGHWPAGFAESLQPHQVGAITAHLRASALYSEASWQAFIANIAMAVKRGIHVMLRYNVQGDTAIPSDHVAEACHLIGVRQVNLALTVPGLSGASAFADERDLRRRAANLVDGCRQIQAAGLRVALSKPLPPCLLTPSQKRLFAQAPHAIGCCAAWQGNHTHNAAVNADGSVWPCIIFNRPVGSFASFSSFDQLGEAVRPAMEARARQLTFSACADCPLYRLRRCQGLCLACKTDAPAAGP